MIATLFVLILLGQCVLLILIYRRIRANVVPPVAPAQPVAAPERSEQLVPASTAVRPVSLPAIWERLERRDGEWVLSGLVRHRSNAWDQALNTPNVALRSPSGEIHEGVQ